MSDIQEKSAIQQKLDALRNLKFLKDMELVYNKLNTICKEETDVSLESFLLNLYELRKLKDTTERT